MLFVISVTVFENAFARFTCLQHKFPVFGMVLNGMVWDMVFNVLSYLIILLFEPYC